MTAGRIPESILDDILSRVDIVEVISGYLPLKRAGRNFRANCPFHHEKTPSFMVSADRQIYHCFGCQAGGNAFKFLMQYERLEFPEAVEALAKKAGVILPQAEKHDSRAESLSAQLFKINELAALFYEQNLNSPSGQAAKNYLLKRGIKEQTLKSFKLGFAGDKWDGLINHLRSKGFSLSLLEKAGVVLSRENGGYYDRFRSRVIFPIFDIKSRVLAFGARVLDESLPKYLNSPETSAYVKGKNLYGLNFSRDFIRDKDCAVVVEGYLDLILPYQEGVSNIVASLGTALTYEQIRLLKRYTRNVVMIYDPDTAGKIATLRTLDMFIEEGVNVKVVSLPQGCDPDLYVRKDGIEKFKEKIENAQNLFEYKLGVLKERYNIKESQGKASIASEMLPTIKKLKNSILVSENIRKISEALNVEEFYVIEELNKIKAERPYADSNQTVTKKALTISPTERLLIKLMLEEADFISRVKESLLPQDFSDERSVKVVSLMFEFLEQGKKVEPKTLINHFGEEISLLICESLFLEVPSDNKEKVIDDCIQRLKDEGVKVKRQYLHSQIKAAQNSGDEQRLQGLMEEFHQLIKKKG